MSAPLVDVDPAEPVETTTTASVTAWELFVTFNFISLQSFGGALALIERTVVQKKRWLTRVEFVELFGLSQVLPGPSGACFCVMLGDRLLGARGGFAALAGFLVVPCLLVLGITAAFQRWQHLAAVDGALHGMGAASLGLIAITAVRLATTLRRRWLAIGIAVLAFIGVGLLHVALGKVMLTVGAVSIAIAWFRGRV